MSIKRTIKDNICYIENQFGDVKEYHITVSYGKENDLDGSINKIKSFIESNKISICFGFGYGNNEFQKKLNMLLGIGKDNLFPLTWIDGTYNKRKKFDGLYLMGIYGTEISNLFENGTCIGSYYEDGYARYTYLGNIAFNNNSLLEHEQAYENFCMIEKGLSKNNMVMSDIIRTWFYNRKILDWYSDFNMVRTSFYKEKKVSIKLIPASTGICGANPFNTALISSAIALKPKNDKVEVKEVDSPLQSTATSYGSTFSRAVIVKLNGFSKLTISGTASIDNYGNTIYKEDIGKQLDHTINSIDSILKESNMTIQNSVRIIVYVKKESDIDFVRNELLKRWGNKLPIILTWATICRDDLLCEIELDAISYN